MVAEESKDTDANGQLAPHTVAAIEKHFLGIVNEQMKLLAEEPPGNGATHAPANGQAEVRQETITKTAESTRAAPAQKPPPKTAATKPAKGKANKRTTRPPKFPYVPQAQLNAELDRLEELSHAALDGDSKALDTLRAELDHVPHVWRRLADLQLTIEYRLIEQVAGSDPLRAEAFRKRCSELRFELLERQTCCMATQMAASRLVSTFMFVQLLELRVLGRPAEQADVKRLEQAERRYHAAMRTYLLARQSDPQLQQLAS